MERDSGVWLRGGYVKREGIGFNLLTDSRLE